MTEKIPPASSWTLPPTSRQIVAITRLAMQLGITEPIEEKPSNRWEARRMIYDLTQQRDSKNKGGVR